MAGRRWGTGAGQRGRAGGRPAACISTRDWWPIVTWNAFVDEIKQWLAERRLLNPQASWVVGVSGGPDSTLLLHTLTALSARLDLGWRLHAAHLHHGLRGQEADEDEVFCSHVAQELGIPFYSERADIRAEAVSCGRSTEEAARAHRYDFLERVALRTGSELVAVGHHADDNAETVLHRICRGTGLRGLAGIHDVRPIRPDSHIRIVRPFLAQRRATIEFICAELGLPVRQDSTNRSPEFTRGRIRQVVLPLLAEQLNPNIVESLLRLAEHARWLTMYLDDAAARTFDALVISQHGRHVVLNVRALVGKQRIVQAEVVRRAITLAAGGEQELSFANIEAVLKLAADPASGKEVHMPGPVLVRKQYERLEFRPLEEEEPPLELGTVFITCPGRTTLAVLGFELTAELHTVHPSQIAALLQNTNRLEEWLDFDRVRLPLLVRGRREGDRFHPLGNPGSKTVSDFLSEQKIDPAVRARTGILCDQAGPLWVMPLRIDERAKLRPTTRTALRLVLTPLPLSQSLP